ncbi:MAG: monovalent cation/H+ antiporter subunit D family protein [Gemmatimonadetes bacterium]|nr:monovalent cation/H+ antiporter subunit D family protein [Gemmatimonadota bacterium]MDA1103239.1 monovalent cation/H+ antiporter subunit D family protein [Gemmatimonadota bacterium]
MSQHLPVLLVAVPLFLAPVAALVGRWKLAWAVAAAGCWWAFAASIMLLRRVMDEGTIHYAMGGWEAPYGIEYRIDLVSAFVALIVAAIGAVVIPYARTSIAKEVSEDRGALFYSAFLLCLSGLLGISVTGDVFNVFVFLEVSSLSAYAMIALGQDRRALTAAFQYLIMGSTGATFIVIGIGLLYVMTGTLNMADLAERLPAVSDNRTIPVAFTFLTVGITLKLALFPLHLWLPNAYTYAPSAVTAFIASTATKVAVYLLLRFFFTVFGAAFAFEQMQLDMVLMPLALVAILGMSLVAIYQENVKRLLAFSSVAQIGYMVLGISFGSVLGVTSGILHLFNHALMKGALFMAMGCVMYSVGSVRIEKMAGLGKVMPWTMAAFVGGGLSLIGVPFTVGFVSKWYLVQAALEQGMWPVAAVVMVGSLMALVYIWKVVEVAYFQAADPDHQIREAPLSMLVPTWVLVLASFYFGIDASTTASIATRAAETLLGVGL